MPSFYTRTGDDGTTGLLGDARVPKYDPRLEAVGAVDEATAALGLARALSTASQASDLLLSIQRDLYHLMAEVAATPDNAARFRSIDADRVSWLELQIDALSQEVEPPREFILPGDSVAGGAMAVARTTIRRAERRLARLVHDGLVENTALLHYLNRLSSLCFLLELLENHLSGVTASNLAKE